MSWIAATLFAAFMQNLRFLLQRHLKVTTLSTMGATWARFAFAMPFVAIALFLLVSVTGQPVPATTPAFWTYTLVGATAQMLATACIVALFARRNFAVGITLMKTEVILSVILGLILLGEGVSPPVLAAIAVSFVGVVLLSDPPRGEVSLHWRSRVFNAASGYGLASGVLFGVSGVCYRGATLSLLSGDEMLRAATALLAATVLQVLTLGLWLAVREAGQIARVFAAWRVAVPTGLTSMLGSLGWFTAFALQTAAYVKALGQVELVFTFLFSVFWLKERSSGKEIAGIALIVGSLLLIILGSF
ncbi:DMT family transporter [Roseibacterium sp. SDUM158016]|uniref:DMT family transporter n=1 Tax=Roseicyclus sediminis TaxID=2980997 RepID=UPI0021D2500E|nr:DMT family transporter [Roseibacterium sp. SDUM158016]MCU4654020.1 DMT family transporter [Roseibacterium sp. SDUM158016]